MEQQPDVVEGVRAGVPRDAVGAARMAADVVRAAVLGESSAQVVGAVLAVLAEGLDVPVVHLTRRDADGVRLVGHHGLAHLDDLVGIGGAFPAWAAHAAALDRGEPVLVPDVSAEPGWLDLSDGRSCSAVLVPVPPSRGEADVVLGLEHPSGSAFGAADGEFLVEVGRAIGGVLHALGRLGEDRRTAERELQRRRASEAGAAVISAGLAATDVRDAARAMAEAAVHELRWPTVALLRVDGTGWVVEAAVGAGRDQLGRRLSDHGVLEGMRATSRTVVGGVVPGEVVLSDGTASRLAAPVRLGDRIAYALLVESPDPHGLDETSRGDAVAVAARMALVLERLELLATERAAHQRLAEVDRMRANLLKVAGHELRTPLTVVVGYAETLAAQAERLEPAALSTAADRLAARARHLSELVDRVLLAARLDSSAIDVVARDVDLGAVLERAPWRGDVEVGQGAAGAVVVADPAWLERALGLLVEHCRERARSHVLLDARVTGDRTAIIVRDDGPGIPGYERERVFRPFDGPGTKGSESGLSPGLARGLVRAMGGELRLYSAVGYGSTFVVVLPSV